jgi:transcriptional regulator with XRE-family HTH domain
LCCKTDSVIYPSKHKDHERGRGGAIQLIAERLREAFEKSDIHTQYELASKINVSPSTMTRFLSGESKPSIEQFAMLCSILEVSSDYILGIGEYKHLELNLRTEELEYIKDLIKVDILEKPDEVKWNILEKLALEGSNKR